MKRVILLNNRQTAPAPELLRALHDAGITTVIAGREHDWSVEEKLPPIATLYEIGVGTTLAEIHAVATDANTLWPEAPLIACRRIHNDQQGNCSRIDLSTLKRLGFHFIADDPAQLPILLRELETDHSILDNHAPEDIFLSSSEPVSFPESMKGKELRATLQMVTSLLFASDQQKAAQMALSGLKTIINADEWTIYLVSDSIGDDIVLEPLAFSHSNNLLDKSSNNNDSNSSSDSKTIISCSETMAVHRAVSNAEIVTAKEGKRHIVASPLTKGERVLGVIEAVREKGSRSFSKLEREILEAVSIPIASALANSVRIAEAERLSLTDDLTKLHNARYLRRYLVSELKRARRYNSPLAVLFLDLDNFKSINDSHGHLVGSHVLMEIAAVILTSVRDTDVIARYGGDEYVIILPETPLQQAMSVAERVREKIASHTFTGGKHMQLSITASFGVAAYPNHAASPQQLIACADMAMYKAKAFSKNCIRAAVVVEG
jgi:diguanylate cyclase (GGDEF)-like protein